MKGNSQSDWLPAPDSWGGTATPDMNLVVEKRCDLCNHRNKLKTSDDNKVLRVIHGQIADGQYTLELVEHRTGKISSTRAMLTSWPKITMPRRKLNICLNRENLSMKNPMTKKSPKDNRKELIACPCGASFTRKHNWWHRKNSTQHKEWEKTKTEMTLDNGAKVESTIPFLDNEDGTITVTGQPGQGFGLIITGGPKMKLPVENKCQHKSPEFSTGKCPDCGKWVLRRFR